MASLMATMKGAIKRSEEGAVYGLAGFLAEEEKGEELTRVS
jgi:hypothetical protein